MEPMDLNLLLLRLNTLSVFRRLTEDPVLSALNSYLSAPTPGGYATFAARLFEANGGDLSRHVQTLCENSENRFIVTVGAGQDVPEHLRRATETDLDTLQALTALTPEDLQAPLTDKEYLPAFSSAPLSLKETYLRRAEQVTRYGYGIYAQHRAFYLDDGGAVIPVRSPDPVRMEDLVDYERERRIVLDNTRALLTGKPAANLLLTGDAGTGKSSTVKATVNALWQDGLRIIEVRKDQLRQIPRLLDGLAENPLKFILFIDDLSFLKDDDNFNALKAVLEGSVSAKSNNVVIYATGNRRHLIKESFADRDGDEVHRNDTLQEIISLSERFGIHVTFSKPDKQTYLHIVHHLAQQNRLKVDEGELTLAAERFALQRGGRSARIARQFIDSLLAANNG